MSNPGRLLTPSQIHDLLYLGSRKKFAFKKACRVVGIDHTTAKNKVVRDSDRVYQKFVEVFPGAFAEDNDREPEWGPKKLRYEDMGTLKIPTDVKAQALRQAWQPGLEVSRGA